MIVLVVEDNADLREMYREILLSCAHTVHLAETAAEAVSTIARERPSIALVDLGIAGGAAGVLAALREAEARVILASGARDLPERAAQIGAASYLQKPFTPEALIETVERIGAAARS